MSLQPIDLQTLFSQLSQVSKEQAALRDGLIQNQSVVGREIVRRSEQQQHTVTQSDEVADGENVHDDDESQKKGEEEKERRRKGTQQDQKREVFREPYLGKNIDLSG